MRQGLVATLSGLLLGLALIPTDAIPLAHWAIFFGFVPLWNLWLQETSGRKILWQGWCAQFLLTLCAFNWVGYTAREYGLLPWPIAGIVLFVFCALANLHLPLAGWIWQKLFPREKYAEPSRILALALLTALGERIFPMIFPWNFGYVWFHENWRGFHLADLIGFSGLSSISILINGLVLWAWRRKMERLTWWYPLAFASLLLGALNWAGLYRRSLVPEPDRALRVLVVQANIGNKQKHEAEFGEKYQEAIVSKYLELTRRGLAAASAYPDFVIWPENAVPSVILDPALSYGPAALIKDLVTKEKVALLTGAYGFEEDHSFTNAAFLISSAGRWATEPYRKTILMPLGEYVPGARFFPALKKLFPQVRDFAAGPGPQVRDFVGARMGLQICYEGLFDWFSGALAQRGADLIVNVTNDSWYGKWQQPYQHFYMTLARAVETRRPLIRATNTGVSGVALASGKILELSPVHTEWTKIYELPYHANAETTPFTRYGYWLVPALLAGALALLWLARRKD